MDIYKSWLAEKRSAYLYRELRKREAKEHFADLFEQLGNEAEQQAEVWKKKAIQQNIHIPKKLPLGIRTRIVAWLIKHYHPKAMLGILAAMKIRGLSVYQNQLPRDAPPTKYEELGQRHSSAGARSNLRAAVFGANDGLVSNAALIMGMAGAESSNEVVLLAGTAGLLAGAFSMASGEYVSVRSQGEMMQHQLNLERDELLMYPEEEVEELFLIYKARGLNEADARKLANRVIDDPEHALEIMAREELGLNPSDLASATGAALSSFISFALGALVPLLPFFFWKDSQATYISAIAFSTTLLAIGIIVSLFTGRSAIYSGFRMLFIGLCAALVTYGAGALFDVVTS